jgi:hypothetical protein
MCTNKWLYLPINALDKTRVRWGTSEIIISSNSTPFNVLAMASNLLVWPANQGNGQLLSSDFT